MNNGIENRHRAVLAFVGLMLVGLAVRWTAWVRAPDSAFLVDRGSDRWLVYDRPPSLQLYPLGTTAAFFRKRFLLDRRVSDWTLAVHAMRDFRAGVDGKELGRPSDGSGWKSGVLVAGAEPLPPGGHELVVIVSNRNGPPALMVRSLDLPVSAGQPWEASLDGRHWSPARPAGRVRWPEQVLAHPGTLWALARWWPWLLLAFACPLAFLSLGGRLDDQGVKRLILLGWAALGINNAWKLPVSTGFDSDLHISYMRHLLEHGSLPVAGGVTQFFQPPLYYLVSLPIYAALHDAVSLHGLVAALRCVPLLCGLGLIEVTHRMARRVFPDRPGLRSASVAVAGLCPMNIYMAQAPGNEPLAAFLTGLTLSLLLGFVLEPAGRRPVRDFAVLGAALGAAMLSKVTPFLLLPVIAAVLARHFVLTNLDWKAASARAGAFLGTALAVCGWFYARSYALFGRPFVGGWDVVGPTGWWQDPGYRVWGHFLSFGRSLTRPIFSGLAGAWDTLHSTLWLDGLLGGNALHPPPWNMAPMLLGSLLGLVPAALVLVSSRTLVGQGGPDRRPALILCWGCLAVYLAAFLDLQLRVPIFSVGKASYLLGLVPCIGILAAAGAEAFLPAPGVNGAGVPLQSQWEGGLQRAWPARVLAAALACWGLVSFCAFFVL
ncbi:MAG: glycosyltransferase family 39 protein [Elusimicrobia bacterium]|nr:glycosyltransferase family 39 protein [Elusimicrobiota bacterium]